MTNPYDFPNVVAFKLLIKKGDRVLLLREPDTNDWMPGRLGLPGGKPLIHETVTDTLERKIKTEVGLEIEIKGILRIVDIIMPQKTVYHFVLAAEYLDGEIDAGTTEADEMEWYSKSQINELTHDDFTEYYNRDVVTGYLNNQLVVTPLNLIVEQDNRSQDIKAWMEKGSK